MTIDAILARLVEARRNAGLSQSQVGHMLGLSTATISDFERAHTPLTLARFLELCQLYCCSPEWALTGVNPYFDPAPLAAQLADASGRLSADAEDLLELLASLRHDPGETHEPAL